MTFAPTNALQTLTNAPTNGVQAPQQTPPQTDTDAPANGGTHAPPITPLRWKRPTRPFGGGPVGPFTQRKRQETAIKPADPLSRRALRQTEKGFKRVHRCGMRARLSAPRLQSRASGSEADALMPPLRPSVAAPKMIVGRPQAARSRSQAQTRGKRKVASAAAVTAAAGVLASPPIAPASVAGVRRRRTANAHQRGSLRD